MKNLSPPYALFSCALLASLGCNPSDFADYGDDAPVRVHSVPKGSSKQSNYGSVLATSHVSNGEISYIAASAGRGSPIVLNRAWNRGVDEQDSLRCGTASECMSGNEDLGGVLIPFEVWGRGGADERKNCVLSPSNVGTGTYGWVVCESKAGGQNFGLGLSGLIGEGDRLHFSGFGLPPNHPLGVALLGVHAEKDKGGGERRNGGLYRVLDRAETVPPPEPIKLREPKAGGEPSFFTDAEDRGDLGREVAGIFTDDGELLLAISQPSKQRVIIASYDDASEAPVTERFVTRACVESPDAALRGFGERVVWGDVTGDGKPELFVGSDPVAGVEPGKQALYRYDGRGLPGRAEVDAATACPEWKEDAVAIACREQAGASCDDAGFGASLAVGDFSGDGRGDLLVGGPLTRVNGVSTGAAWIYPGAASGLELERTVVLTSESNARFGATVAALRSRGERSEPVIGAPGLSKIFVYTCTELESAFDVANFCLP